MLPPEAGSAQAGSGTAAPDSHPAPMAPPDATQPHNPEDAATRALLGVARSLAGARSRDELVEAVAAAALLAVPEALSAAVYLVDAAGEILQPLAARACRSAAEEWHPIPLVTPAMQEVLAAEGSPAVCDGHLAARLTSCAEDPLLVAPLSAGQRTIGMLGVRMAPDTRCDPAARGRLAIVAAQAALALRWAVPQRDAPLHEILATALDRLEQGVAIVQGGTRVRYVNLALLSLLGLPPEDLALPCCTDDACCPLNVRILLNPSGAAIRGAYSVALDLPTGAAVTLEVLPSRLGPDTEARLVVDVSDQRQLARTRAQFTSQVAHELRTPLQHIMGFASILSDVPDLPEETVQRFLGHIGEESKRATRLVEDLSEISRIEDGRFAVDRKNVRVDELLNDVVARLSHEAQVKGLELTLSMDHRPLWAVTDRFRLEQVVTNLIENAIKFVEPGGRIAVRLEAEGADLLLHVADTGPGIPSEALRRIFDRYYQVPRQDGRATRGMGLGLYISREIVHALGGEIWVESELGVGSTFSVRLPRS